jgi:hypothetical protein
VIRPNVRDGKTIGIGFKERRREYIKNQISKWKITNKNVKFRIGVKASAFYERQGENDEG